MQVQAATATVLIPADKPSPFRGAPWEDVFSLMSQRFMWEEDDLNLKFFTDKEAASSSEFAAACKSSDVFVAVDMDKTPQLVQDAARIQRPVTLVFDSSPVCSSDLSH